MSDPRPPLRPEDRDLDETRVDGDRSRTRRPGGFVSRAHDPHVYTEGEVIGRGGMGEVVSVFDRALARHVVMKRMHGNLATGENLERFLTEARVTGGLSHPNIVPVYEIGVGEAGQPFFTMKHVDGSDLRSIISRLADGDPETHARFTLPRRLALFGAVCNAMAFAHERGVVHRDLKPANIMVGAFGEVLVMDWGLARVRGDSRSSLARAPSGSRVDPDALGELDDPLLTQDGAVMGTPGFMSPEQARGDIEMVDARSDIYSLGVVLFELLLFRPPYRGKSIWELLACVTDGTRDAPGTIAGDPRVARELVAILDKAMALDPHDRYQTVQALHADLLAFSDHRAIAAASYTPLQRLGTWLKRHRGAVVAAMLALVALFGGVWLTTELQRRNAAQAREAGRAAAWDTLRAAQATPSDDWYARQTAVLEAARALVAVDPGREARAQRAEAARALARRLGDDGNARLAGLLLGEAEAAGLPAKAVELERWMIRTAPARRGQSAAVEVGRLLDAIRGGDIVASLALHRVIGFGASEASTHVLIQRLFSGHRQVATVCAQALAGLGDRTTEAMVGGKVANVAVRRGRVTINARQDVPAIAPLAKVLASVTANAGRAGGPTARRTLTPATALALALHTRVLSESREVAELEIPVVWAALSAIDELADPAAVPLLALWQWRQGPDSLGWMLAERVLRRLEAPETVGEVAGIERELLVALTHLSTGRDAEALAAIDRSLASEGAVRPALLRYLRAFALRTSDPAAGLRELARVQAALAKVAKPSRRHAAWRGVVTRLQGQLELAAGRREAGLATLRRAGEQGDGLARQRLAREAEGAGEVERAIADAQSALERDHLAQGARLVLCRLTKDDALDLHTRAAIAMDPGAVDARLLRAGYLRAQGRALEAIAMCSTAIHQRDDPAEAADALLLRGLVQLELCESDRGKGNKKLALRDLERAVAARPKDLRFRLEWLRGMVVLERLGEAITIAQRFDGTPLARSATALQAWAQWVLGRHRDAFGTARRALEGARGDEPHLTYAWLTRGLMYGIANQPAQMRQDLARARTLASPVMRARIDLALARREGAQGRVDEAIAACRAAIAATGPRWLHARVARAHLERWLMQRGVAHARAGRRTEAIRDLTAAMNEGTGARHVKRQVDHLLKQLR